MPTQHGATPAQQERKRWEESNKPSRSGASTGTSLQRTPHGRRRIAHATSILPRRFECRQPLFRPKRQPRGQRKLRSLKYQEPVPLYRLRLKYIYPSIGQSIFPWYLICKPIRLSILGRGHSRHNMFCISCVTHRFAAPPDSQRTLHVRLNRQNRVAYVYRMLTF